jgi:hypothetical protein
MVFSWKCLSARRLTVESLDGKLNAEGADISLPAALPYRPLVSPCGDRSILAHSTESII